MKFLDIFRKGKHKESAVLIDIGTRAVVGAYAHFNEGDLPSILYSTSVPIETRSGETNEQSMLRALKALGEVLIREGAPVLSRATGSGSARMILVSVDAPWQETTVHVEDFEEDEPFVFTQSLVAHRLEEGHVAPTEKLLADESIIGTILNGYETRSPYGKKVHRASVIVLTSLIERSLASGIITTLERLYHTKNILPIAGSSLRYQAMREVFPHESDAIIIDATNESTSSVSLVRNNIFVSLVQAKTASTETTWAAMITSELTELAKQYPLPRTIFLLAREPEINDLKGMLDTTNFTSLWLSDNPPKIVPVLKSHMSTLLKQLATTSPDVVIFFMTLYYQNRHRILEEEL